MSTNWPSTIRSSVGRGKWKPSGLNDVDELNAAGCCGVQALAWCEPREEVPDRDSCTAVRDELSEEKMLEPRVTDEAAERTLIWSKEFRWLEAVSPVELELYVLCESL